MPANINPKAKTGIAETSWYWRGGMQNLLIDFILNPQLVHDLARIATDLDIAAIDMAVK